MRYRAAERAPKRRSIALVAGRTAVPRRRGALIPRAQCTARQAGDGDRELRAEPVTCATVSSQAAPAPKLSRPLRLRLVLIANLALVGVLVGVGLAAHSLGVLAEGVDYLADAAVIAVSLVAIKLATLPPTPRHPQGYPRATRYAALVNAGWLLVLTTLVAAAAVDRLVTGAHDVHGLPVLIVSAVATLVMLAGALLLKGDLDDDVNVRAVLLDTAADSAAAGGVAVAGAVIYVTHGTYWLDPAMALAIALVVGYHAVRLLVRIRGELASVPADPSEAERP